MSRQILLAIRDLYSQEPDLIGGAYNRRNANYGENASILLDIGYYPIATTAIAQQYYSDFVLTSTECDFTSLIAPTDYQYVDMLSCYQIGAPTILMPVIKVDVVTNIGPDFWDVSANNPSVPVLQDPEEPGVEWPTNSILDIVNY